MRYQLTTAKHAALSEANDTALDGYPMPDAAKRAFFEEVKTEILATEGALADRGRASGPGKHKNKNPNLFSIERPRLGKHVGSAAGTYMAVARRVAKRMANTELEDFLALKYKEQRRGAPRCFGRAVSDADKLLIARERL